MPKLLSFRIILFMLTVATFITCVSTMDVQPIKKTISPISIIPSPQNGYGSGPDQLAQPDDVEILGNGNMVITDVDNNRIQLFEPSGQLIKTIDATAIGLENPEIIPTGIASDGEGNIYITLEGVGTIARFNGELEFELFIGYQGKVTAEDYYLPQHDGLLIKPQGIIVSENGDVFVIDMAKKVFKKDGVRNFGFRKFKQIISDSGVTYAYDREYAHTQEVTTVMRKSEGMAISEKENLLFIAEEKPHENQFSNKHKYRYIAVFDLTTGVFKNRLIGVDMEIGQIISGTTEESIEGLSVMGNLLFAVAEKAGRVDCYNIQSGQRIVNWGTPAPFYCDDESDCIIDGVNYNEQAIMAGNAPVHKLNNWRHNELASPDGICAKKLDSGEERIAVVDQWNSRVLLYKYEDIIPSSK